MRYTVSKEFHFEAAHSLPHLPVGHKCRRLHGHSYRFVVHCAGEIDPALGWFIDYAEISEAVEENITGVLDHQNLNDFLPISTAEKLAQWIWDRLDPFLEGLSCIEVFETASTCVRLEK